MAKNQALVPTIPENEIWVDEHDQRMSPAQVQALMAQSSNLPQQQYPQQMAQPANYPPAYQGQPSHVTNNYYAPVTYNNTYHVKVSIRHGRIVKQLVKGPPPGTQLLSGPNQTCYGDPVQQPGPWLSKAPNWLIGAFVVLFCAAIILCMGPWK